MAAKDIILSMLAQNIPATQIAATLGVSDSYVSQLATEEGNLELINQEKVKQTEGDIAFDRKLDIAEEEYLDKIQDKSKFANLQQSLQAFRILNSAKRRKESRIQAPQIAIGQIVNITMPVTMVPQMILNAKNEIVEVEGKTMVSATPRKLDEILLLRNGGTAPAKEQLPGITKVERAAGVLQTIENRPQRKRPKEIDLSDLM
jgi:hypothetical protein